MTARDEKTLTLKAFAMIQNASGERYEKTLISTNIGSQYEGGLDNGESKKVLAFKANDIKFTKKFHFDYAKNDQVAMVYEIKNEKSSGLLEVMLPAGKARIYQEDSSGSEAFLGEDYAQETGAGQKFELKLGQAKEVKVKRTQQENREKVVKLPIKHFHQVVKYQIENFKNTSVPLTVMEHPGGEWEVEGLEVKEESGERDTLVEKSISAEGVKTERVDIDNLKIHIQVPSNGKAQKKMNIYLKIMLKNRW